MRQIADFELRTDTRRQRVVSSTGMKRALSIVFIVIVTGSFSAQTPAPPSTSNARLDALKKEVVADIDSRAVFTQQFVDQVFSYGELGFQEFETSAYITAIL